MSAQQIFKKFPFIVQAIFLFILFCSLPAQAYRPFSTEDAGVAGKDVTQMEVSWDYLRWDNGDQENNLLLVLIHGFTERFEFSMEIPYLYHNYKDVQGFDGYGDINLVGKYLLVEEEKRNPAFAVKAVAKMASGDMNKGLGSGSWDYSLFAVASKQMGSFNLHGMIGYTFIGNSGGFNISNITPYSIGVDYKVNEKFHLVGEVGSYIHPDRLYYANPSTALIGATYKINDNLTLDAGYRFSLTNSSFVKSTTVGISVTF